MRIELCKPGYRMEGCRQKLAEILPGEWRSWTRLLTVFAFGAATGLLGAVWMLKPHHSAPNFSLPAARSTAPAPHRLAAKGPWGNLEYTRIMLEPDELFLDPEKRPPAKWYFPDFSAPQLKVFFNSCDLTEAQRKFLLDTNRWQMLTNGTALLPTDELVLGLKRAACQRIYPALARSRENDAQNFPFRFPLDGFDERFANCGLSPEKIQLIRTQTYTNDGWLCFSSLHPMHRTFTADEFRHLKRALYKIPTLRVRLRLTPDSNIEELLKYWAKGREKAVRPILESLARAPAGETIGIGRFLPPFARLRLYTYPDPYADPAVAKEDCFFTALNFFNDQPDPLYLDHRNIRGVLLSKYYEPLGEAAFGDLFMLMDSADSAIHVCVYLADDVVFTKNGVGYLEPWVLMKMSDIMADYPADKPLHMVHLRRKEAGVPSSPL